MNHDQQFDPFNGYQFNLTSYEHRTMDALLYRARRNLKELIKLINGLFNYHSRILVVRIDLRYDKHIPFEMPIEAVQIHREQLLNSRSDYPEIFNGLLGYAWGLEYGEQEGGYHYHFLFFFDGAKRHEDIRIGRAIGELWNDITGGIGQCYISNFDKDRMQAEGNLGIGMIHRNNLHMRINLIEKVAAYITKKCTNFDVQSDRTQSGDFRTFGRSWIPKPLDPNVPRRGRPPISRNR